jgi:GNAT superfamily N-acetyltransferase
MSSKSAPLGLEIHPVTPDRWRDLEKLFGKRGACGGCWCMWWRMQRSEFDQKKGAGTKRALKKLVSQGQVPGLLAYAEDEPVGWCSVAPREDFSTLERSRILKRVDDEPVWSVVCFFVARSFRRKGVANKLLAAAVEYAREHGAKIVEGYPVEPKVGKSPDVFVFTGLASAFRQVGFVEVTRRSETRPIMRYMVER